MASDYDRLQSGPLQLRGQTGRIVAPDDVAGRILNMELTESGTLRSVQGPVEYHPASWVDDEGQIPAPPNTSYGTPHLGLFHCRLEGGKRDILLAHYNSRIYVHQGWVPDWKILLGDTVLAEYETSLPENDDRPNFLTQFVSTPSGVVIVPQGGRAYFYDGVTVAPLGFDSPPGPPTPYGPRSQFEEGTTGATNDQIADSGNTGGYYHNGRTNNNIMGFNRLGTIRTDVFEASSGKTNPLGGILEPGEWRAAVQFVDHWGNVSPISQDSAPVTVVKEDNLTKDKKRDLNEAADRLRVQFAWADLDKGPPHCIARNILRTKDLKNSGIPGMWIVPANSKGSALSFATLHNNTQEMYPDNIPDSWLIRRPIDPDPVPRFRVACMAFGRLWIGNTDASPGVIRPSAPFFWGTFPKGQEIFPDASGASITGMHAASSGLLVFTETSTFLVTQADDGQGFRTATLHPSVGCVSPDSIKTLPNGMTVWLGREGFYGWSGEGLKLISSDIRETVTRRINKAWRSKACAAVDPKMGEYRCWIPVDGSRDNNLCVVFDGLGWRERNDCKASAVCTTKDDRHYMLALGTVATDESGAHSSVWLLDHAAKSTKTPSARDSLVETHWLKSARSHRKSSPKRVTVWMREGGSGSLTVETMRDWREHPLVPERDTGLNDKSYELYDDSDPPPFWDSVTYDSTYYNKPSRTTIPRHLVRRRPIWVKRDIHVPSCDTFRIRLKFQGDWEFVAIHYEDVDAHGGGVKQPMGGVR